MTGWVLDYVPLVHALASWVRIGMLRPRTFSLCHLVWRWRTGTCLELRSMWRSDVQIFSMPSFPALCESLVRRFELEVCEVMWYATLHCRSGRVFPCYLLSLASCTCRWHTRLCLFLLISSESRVLVPHSSPAHHSGRNCRSEGRHRTLFFTHVGPIRRGSERGRKVVAVAVAIAYAERPSYSIPPASKSRRADKDRRESLAIYT